MAVVAETTCKHNLRKKAVMELFTILFGHITLLIGGSYP